MLLAAVAVAMGARRYASRHIDAVALMKCMGAAQGFVLAISIIELTCLALIAVVIGARSASSLNRDWRGCCASLIRANFPPASSAPLPIALVTVLAMLIGFALPPLLQLKSTPPARVLRKTVRAPPLRYGVSYVLALAALCAILWSMVRDTELVLACSPAYSASASVLTSGRLRPGAPHHPPARRRRRGMALRPRQCVAPRQRQRRCRSWPSAWG